MANSSTTVDSSKLNDSETTGTNNSKTNNDANFDDDSPLAQYVVHMQSDDNLNAFKQASELSPFVLTTFVI